MTIILIAFYSLALVARAIALAISLRHEKQLKAAGAMEYGKTVSALIVAVWVTVFIASLTEALWWNRPLDWLSGAALALWLLAMLVLSLVIRQLGGLWTFKILIATDHVLIVKPLFRWFRHPNYFLNMIPEMLAICLFGHSYLTLGVGLPVYGLLIALRIREEERVMRQSFAEY